MLSPFLHSLAWLSLLFGSPPSIRNLSKSTEAHLSFHLVRVSVQIEAEEEAVPEETGTEEVQEPEEGVQVCGPASGTTRFMSVIRSSQ